MRDDPNRFEWLKRLFPGYRRMRHLEHRLEMLRAELLAALSRESTAVSDSVNQVRTEGHAERASAFLRQIAAIKEQASNLSETIAQGNASLAGQIERVRVEGHAERDSAILRQLDAVKEQASNLSETIAQGNASLAGQIERVRVEGHAERDSAILRQLDAVKEQTANLAETITQVNVSLAGQIERVRVEGHAERDSAIERQLDAVKEQASNLSETIAQGNASLAGQIERVRVEGHAERDSAILRQLDDYAKKAGEIRALIENIRADFSASRGAYEDLAKQLREQTSSECRKMVETLFRNEIRCRWQVVDALDSLLFPPKTVAKCPICGYAAARETFETKVSECIFGGGRLERYVCPDCGAIFGPLKMVALSETQLAEEYKQSYSVYSESDCTMLEKIAFRELKPEKGGKYLNYGAGAWNRTTKELRDEGYDVYDFEPFAPVESNPWVIRSMNDLVKMKFDGIFSNDLIEHLRNPVADLTAMKKLLKRNGVMVHCSGCYEYAFEYTRFHLFFLTGNSLSRLCAATGLAGDLGERLFDYSPARLCRFTRKGLRKGS